VDCSPRSDEAHHGSVSQKLRKSTGLGERPLKVLMGECRNFDLLGINAVAEFRMSQFKEMYFFCNNILSKNSLSVVFHVEGAIVTASLRGNFV